MPEEQSGSDMSGFDRCNLSELVMERGPQHDGEGDIFFRRIAARQDLDGPCNFIDYAEVPPGCTIGRHHHELDEEEFYLVLGGEGQMSRGDEVFRVRAGDLIRNKPDMTHGLANVGSEVIRLFVIQLSVSR
jgi:mannose-6-phosphate isomerase-like protein (cupin superfamily)